MTTTTDEVATIQERAGTAVVQANDITRRYGEGDTAVDALRGCSMEVRRGELTAVMGPSGSGKSTLMHILAGLDRPTTGSVSIEGQDVTKLGDNDLTKLRRDHIGFIFQFFNLLPMLTAEENIRLPLELAGGKVDGGWVNEVISKVGLSDRRTHRPSELSGGQQQRVAEWTVIVRHDALAAAIADRVLFLADGCIVKELRGADAGEILTAMEEVSRR
jgi:putative ABC transport system ATP-binding protein